MNDSDQGPVQITPPESHSMHDCGSQILDDSLVLF
jgi:hypothetical protein